MATFLELQDLCLSWLDDLDAGYFTRPQLAVWLNNAQRECQKQLLQAGASENWYETTKYGNTVAEQSEYTMPTDFLKVNKFEVVASGTGINENKQVLDPVTTIQLNQQPLQTGLPAVYGLKKNCFVLKPIPDQIYKIYLTYSYRVVDMTVNSQVPDVPEQYHEYLPVLAVIDGFFKDTRDVSQFVAAKRDFYIEMMKQDANSRRVDFPRTVNSTEDGSWNTGYSF